MLQFQKKISLHNEFNIDYIMSFMYLIIFVCKCINTKIEFCFNPVTPVYMKKMFNTFEINFKIMYSKINHAENI